MIRLYSKNPFVYQGTDLKLSLGNNFWRKAEISHYKRMNDKTAFAVSAFYDGQNGFFTNKYTGERADKFNEFGGKTRLLWNPNERLDLSFCCRLSICKPIRIPIWSGCYKRTSCNNRYNLTILYLKSWYSSSKSESTEYLQAQYVEYWNRIKV